MTEFRFLAEAPGNPYRLGRHQVPAALHPAKDARTLTNWFQPIKDVDHTEFVPVFNQGDLGSCTANAALGCLVTAPFGHAGVSLTEADAVTLYTLETQIDDSQIPGHYPPQDTGSTGPWSMEALIQQGKIRDYVHTTSFHLALRLLNKGPISIGVTWFQSMFTVDSKDEIVVDPHSGEAGGHQICVVGNDVENQLLHVRNSWGTAWGDAGHAWLAWEAFDFLLDLGGDVVQPVMA